MKRRQIIRYGATSLFAAIATTGMTIPQLSQAQDAPEAVTIQYLGHSCFLFVGSGLKVLVNPYLAAGCTAGYVLADVQPDLVLVSSFLLDEGAVEEVKGNPEVITTPGDRQVGAVKFQGVTMPHDREGGRRFGNNIAWRWTQGGVNILHLGGAAASISTEEKILLSSPDILLIPVGGGAKNYNPQEAQQAIASLKPKVVIPTQYLTEAADPDDCDLEVLDNFLNLVRGMEIKKLDSDRITIRPQDLPQDRTIVRVLDAGATVNS